MDNTTPVTVWYIYIVFRMMLYGRCWCWELCYWDGLKYVFRRLDVSGYCWPSGCGAKRVQPGDCKQFRRTSVRLHATDGRRDASDATPLGRHGPTSHAVNGLAFQERTNISTRSVLAAGQSIIFFTHRIQKLKWQTFFISSKCIKYILECSLRCNYYF